MSDAKQEGGMSDVPPQMGDDGPDAELLRRCAALEAQHVTVETLREHLDEADHEAWRDATGHWLDLMLAVERTPATTLGGLQRKAGNYPHVSRILTGDAPHSFTVMSELAFLRSLVVDIVELKG